MSETARQAAPARIVVEGFDGDGREINDHLRALLFIDDEPMREVTFSLSHIDFMRTNAESIDDVADGWNRAIEEMAKRLAAELTYAGLLRFDNPINVQSHLSSFTEPNRSGLRVPGTVLVEFEI